MIFGRSGRNWTLVLGFGDRCSTVELHSHQKVGDTINRHPRKINQSMSYFIILSAYCQLTCLWLIMNSRKVFNSLSIFMNMKKTKFIIIMFLAAISWLASEKPVRAETFQSTLTISAKDANYQTLKNIGFTIYKQKTDVDGRRIPGDSAAVISFSSSDASRSACRYSAGSIQRTSISLDLGNGPCERFS